jgi:hypothetical protein
MANLGCRKSRPLHDGELSTPLPPNGSAWQWGTSRPITSHHIKTASHYVPHSLTDRGAVRIQRSRPPSTSACSALTVRCCHAPAISPPPLGLLLTILGETVRAGERYCELGAGDMADSPKPRLAACLVCRRSKIKCDWAPSQARCRRCIQLGRDCIRPDVHIGRQKGIKK